VYGRRRSHTTVVLFGDSHAMQYFPALQRLAKARRWRLVVLTKAGCTPAALTVVNAELGRPYPECDLWRERALRRIERAEHPKLVITTGATHYAVVDGDRRLKGARARAMIAAAYAPTLRRLQAAAGQVRVLRESPRPPRDIPACVAKQLSHLRRCAFARRPALDHPSVEAKAASLVPGVRAIDLTSRFCPRRLCPAVIGGALVYRNAGHITATYSATLARWLGRRLPRHLG
jgi:hypothetical protein